MDDAAKRDKPKPAPKPNPSIALTVVSANISALLSKNPRVNTQPKLAKRAKMDQKTVNRIVNRQNEPTLEQVSKLAKAFGLEPWQMLVPGLEPTNPPVIAREPEAMRKLYERLQKTREAIDGTLRDAGNTDPGDLDD